MQNPHPCTLGTTGELNLREGAAQLHSNEEGEINSKKHKKKRKGGRRPGVRGVNRLLQKWGSLTSTRTAL